jgi:hypothetical protein
VPWKRSFAERPPLQGHIGADFGERVRETGSTGQADGSVGSVPHTLISTALSLTDDSGERCLRRT